MFWSNNPVGEALVRAIDALVEASVLERDAEDRVRWNSSFIGTWDALRS